MLKVGTFNRYLAIAFMFAAFGLPCWANAASIDWIPKQDKSGFTVMIPSVDIKALAIDISARLLVLEEDEKRLAEKVTQTQIKGGDAALAVILPGGLLYVGIKEAKHSKAVKAHDRVTAEQKELKADLAALESMRRDV